MRRARAFPHIDGLERRSLAPPPRLALALGRPDVKREAASRGAAAKAVSGKSVVVKFDGGLLSSDGGALALREIEQRLRGADRLAGCVVDRRAPDLITHSLADIIRFRLLMVSAGYLDGIDADSLRSDPMFKMALDIDDTFDAVHGGRQLWLFNAHYDEYGFEPIVVFDGEGRFITAALRPAKQPSGREIKPFLRRLLRAIRAHWPHTEIWLTR